MGERIHGSLKMVIYFDICLQKLSAYFVSMGLGDEEASQLHHKYYTQYGLAIRGLVRHHQIGAVMTVYAISSNIVLNMVHNTLDALDFDRRCDGSLPLESMIKPDPQLRQLLKDIDRSKARVWGLTNAYQTVRIRNHTANAASHEILF